MSSSSSVAIPSKMKETVRNLREIVDCTEQEIVTMLRECNMDPNEAVHRLLAQDTFHEVKSKREKKKEIKVPSHSRPQRVSSSSGRGPRVGTDQTGRSANQNSSKDSEVSYGKQVHSNENGTRAHTSSVSGSRGIANSSSTSNVTPSSYSDALGNSMDFPGLSDSSPMLSQPSATLQNSWSRVPGQPSMADIVKMGRPQQKPSSMPAEGSQASNTLSSKAVVPNTIQGSARCGSSTATQFEGNQEKHLSLDVSLVCQASHEPSTVVGQDESLEEWTLVEHSADESSPVLVDVAGGSSVHHEPSASSSFCMDEFDPHHDPSVDGIQSGENLPTTSTSSVVQASADSSVASSYLPDGSLRNQQHEAAVVHERSSDMRHLNINTDEQRATSKDDRPAVIIPGHLQVTSADSSYLSFGSFGSGIGASLPGSILSNTPKSNHEVTADPETASAVDYSNRRNQEYYSDEQLRTTPEDSVSLFTSPAPKNYDAVSSSQPEHRRDDEFVSEQLKYNIPTSTFAFSATAQPDRAAYDQASSQIPNHAPTSHIDSSQSNLFSGNSQPLRESDLSFLRSLENQSVASKYNTSMSVSGPTNMPEVLKSGLLSNFQSSPQTTSSNTISGGPALHPHLSVPAYSQPTHPLGPLTNMYTYPFLPQSIPYMPFSGNNAFYQSPASLQSAGLKYGLPQFKSSMPPSGLPQSLSNSSGYGGFGSSNIPGAYLQNSMNVPAGSAIGFEALKSQYKESSPLHQADTSSMWLRSQQAQPNSFYGLQGHSPQASNNILRHQQPQHMGIMGYPNLYHSQVGGISRDHQLAGQGNLNGSQGQASQQSHQPWQHNYLP